MNPIVAPLFAVFAFMAGCTYAPKTVPPDSLAAWNGGGTLDDLFVRLRQARSDNEAEPIEVAIIQIWASSGRPEVDDLMLRGLEMAHHGDLDEALGDFNRIIQLVPNFAEAYNQRAVVHVMRDEYPDAIRDLNRVLMLEPRHFGALAGLGRIMMLFDHDRMALKCFDAALAVNPHLESIREQADELREKLAGLSI